MMDEKTERETHELVLAAIFQGRLLAQEWQDVGLVPQGAAKPFILELLKGLLERHGLDEMDEERVRMLGDQIRRFTNEHREGLGDRAMEMHIDTDNVHDTKVVDLINLAWRWRQFRAAKQALDDKLAAIRETDRRLSTC